MLYPNGMEIWYSVLHEDLRITNKIFTTLLEYLSILELVHDGHRKNTMAAILPCSPGGLLSVEALVICIHKATGPNREFSHTRERN